MVEWRNKSTEQTDVVYAYAPTLVCAVEVGVHGLHNCCTAVLRCYREYMLASCLVNDERERTMRLAAVEGEREG